MFLRPGNLLVVKICDRDIEYFGEPLQPPGADTVGALFVFLHLLKRQPERISDGCLRNTEVEPPYFKAATDFTIRGRRTSLSHKFTSSIVRKISKSRDERPVLPDERLTNSTVCAGEAFEHID